MDISTVCISHWFDWVLRGCHHTRDAGANASDGSLEVPWTQAFSEIFALHFVSGIRQPFCCASCIIRTHQSHQSHHRDTFNIYKFINLKSQQSNASDISRIYIYLYASGGSIAVVGFSIQSACCNIFKHNLIQPFWFHRCLGFKQFSAILRQKRNISQPTSPPSGMTCMTLEKPLNTSHSMKKCNGMNNIICPTKATFPILGPQGPPTV